MITQRKTANAVGGRTARACESCLKRRARWFCPADDAFLCQACDLLVHSANELAGRHKRVRLETASSSSSSSNNYKPSTEPPSPSWHQGFTKKARTPRNSNKALKPSYNLSQMPVVPEVGNDDNEEGSVEENEESDMVFTVPTLGPFEKEFNNNGIHDDDFNISLIGFEGDEWDNLPLPGILPTELAEFAANVESLLEQEEGVKGEEKDDDIHLQGAVHDVCFPGIKMEQEGETTPDHCYFDWSIDVETEMLNFDLNYTSNCVHHESAQVSGEEGEEQKKGVVPKDDDEEEECNKKRRKILLRLNYEEVINAWASQSCLSPWITGHRPEFDLDHHGWPNCLGDVRPTDGVHGHDEEWMGERGNIKDGDGGREARVSRYREKRRTRLFSKKIRYEVRKLNAEKRPRLKGRFIKRTSLSSPLIAVGSLDNSTFT